MLLNCPECELQVSDKALICPHCGYPMLGNTKRKPTRKSNKRRRLPNGFGQISEIKNRNLRNPYRAMVTVGKNSKGKPICKLLKPVAFFATYNDAYTALVEYNKNPYDIEKDITVSELYDKWTDEYFKTLKSESSIRTIKSAWSYCSEIYDMPVQGIRARHIKGCMENGTIIYRNEERKPTEHIKSRIKSMFNIMLDYALEYELVDKNYARTFSFTDDEEKDSKGTHIPFTDNEMKTLWDNVEYEKYIDIILIQCYSGWRPQELGLIELNNVDLDNGLFVGGMKTNAGINRTVPIHPRIFNFVKNRYDEACEIGSKYLFNCTDSKNHVNGSKLTYDKYRNRFLNIIKKLKLNPEHKPHDGRKHFITKAKKYNMDEYAIKYIVGHTINDITEKVYTERDTEWLISEIQKIK